MNKKRGPKPISKNNPRIRSPKSSAELLYAIRRPTSQMMIQHLRRSPHGIEEPYSVNKYDLQYQYEKQEKIVEPSVHDHDYEEQVIASPQYSNFERKQLEGISDSIIGLSDLKGILIRCLDSKEPTNVLLCDPPASAKTLFLLAIHKEMADCYCRRRAIIFGIGLWIIGLPTTEAIVNLHTIGSLKF